MIHYRVVRLLAGLLLYATGIVLTIQANIGLAPWDVLHVGLSRTLGLSIGAASILVGFVIIALLVLCKEKMGFGTLLNMALIGVFIDLLFRLNFIPRSTTIWSGLLELIVGLFVISAGSYYYIGSRFGAGPRDCLMILLTRKLKLPVGAIRTTLEITVIAVGWMLGGTVGLGTLTASILIGFCIQVTFHLVKFDPAAITQQSFSDTIKELRKN